MTRILCVWLLHWPTTAWRLSQPRACAAPDETPLALVAKVGAVRKLQGVNACAEGMGLYVGQKAADAQALIPQLRLEALESVDPVATLARLADWCARFSPAVAEGPPEALFLDITGLSHLWGSEADLLADLHSRLHQKGIAIRTGIADTVGAAWALARHGGEDIAPPGAQARLLADFPIAALRLAPDSEAQLQRLGLVRIRHLMTQPRASLSLRFGPHVCLRLDQALGQAPEALRYRRPPTPWLQRLRLVEPISTPEDMTRVAHDLAEGLCKRLLAERRAARCFEFVFHRLDGAAAMLEVALAGPGREPAVVLRLIRERLPLIDPGFGIEEASLAAREVTLLSDVQPGLEADFGGQRQASLDALIETLSNRLGAEAVWRPQVRESHEPERAVVKLPALQSIMGATATWDEEKPRPIRLFHTPEPIQATAPLPDDPPILFRWRGGVHRIRRAEGPERIAREWWRQPIDDISPGQIRDYYRVEDECGGRYWLFRAGLHGAQEEKPRWWLHGVFA